MHDKSLETVAVAADMISGGLEMGSVSSVNQGVADLLQTLSSLNLPVLSSPGVTSALEKAPTADIVQLSMAANELENVDAMFGISDGSNAADAQLLSAGTSKASSAGQLANDLQLTEAQGLFGTGATNSLSGSLFDVMG